MIPVGGDRAAAEAAGAADDQPVLGRLDLASERGQRLAHGRDPVALLAAQLRRVADRRLALGEAGGERDQRQLVDRERYLGAAGLGPPQLCRRDAQRAARLGRRARRRLDLDAAPIRPRISSRPVRVGLSPTPVSASSLPGTIVAATTKKAAAEMSPGTAISPGFEGGAPGWIVTASPSRPTSAPAAASIRSLWSRLGAGSTTRVSPSARRPASSRHDLTWALATGSSYSIPLSGAPSTRSGGKPVLAAAEARPHQPQRVGDPVDRPAPDRVVAVEGPGAARPAPRASPAAGAAGCRRCRRRSSAGSAPRRPTPSIGIRAGDPAAETPSTSAPSARSRVRVERVSAESR